MLASLIEDDIISQPTSEVEAIPETSTETVVEPQQNMKKVEKVYTPASHFSDLDRDIVLAECTSEPHSTALVSKQSNVSRSNIHYWAKKAGMEMPVIGLKRKVVEQCASGEASPAKLAKIHGRAPATIRNWTKQSGKVLPGKYDQNLCKETKTSQTQVHFTNKSICFSFLQVLLKSRFRLFSYSIGMKLKQIKPG